MDKEENIKSGNKIERRRMKELPDILIGRKQICQAMGDVCWRTARKQIKFHKVPITYVGRAPAIPRILLIEYYKQRCLISIKQIKKNK